MTQPSSTAVSQSLVQETPKYESSKVLVKNNYTFQQKEQWQMPKELAMPDLMFDSGTEIPHNSL